MEWTNVGVSFSVIFSPNQNKNLKDNKVLLNLSICYSPFMDKLN